MKKQIWMEVNLNKYIEFINLMKQYNKYMNWHRIQNLFIVKIYRNKHQDCKKKNKKNKNSNSSSREINKI